MRPLTIAAAAGAYALLRRRALRGGATTVEVREALPGDELIPPPAIQTTHAIDIAVKPSAVWPWLMQAGFRGAGRAGWYSDSWLDRVLEASLFKFTVPVEGRTHERAPKSATVLLDVPEPVLGGTVPDGPPGSAWFVVKELTPERTYVLWSDSHAKLLAPTAFRGTPLEASGEFTWAFVLRPTAHGTRLILRARMVMRPAIYRVVMPPLLYVGEAVLPQAILRGVRARAEAFERVTAR
jgi:hypothetical protein